MTTLAAQRKAEQINIIETMVVPSLIEGPNTDLVRAAIAEIKANDTDEYWSRGIDVLGRLEEAAQAIKARG